MKFALIPSAASAWETAAVRPTASRLEWTARLIRAHSPSAAARMTHSPSSSRTMANASASSEEWEVREKL